MYMYYRSFIVKYSLFILLYRYKCVIKADIKCGWLKSSNISQHNEVIVSTISTWLILHYQMKTCLSIKVNTDYLVHYQVLYKRPTRTQSHIQIWHLVFIDMNQIRVVKLKKNICMFHQSIINSNFSWILSALCRPFDENDRIFSNKSKQN